MESSTPILATLRGSLSAVSATVTSHSGQSRNDLGRAICRQFNLVTTRGKLRLSGCMKALSTLAHEGHFTLPEKQSESPVRGPRCLDIVIPKPSELPLDVRKIKDLEIAVVSGSEDRMIWNTLLAAEHPLGTTTFAGPQVRYLIQSAHGILGVVGFSGAALYLQARDQWMAWDHDKRSTHLHRVMNLSRYLIRSDGRCKNLGSYVLSRVLRRFSGDFSAQYGYEPYIVETFVGPEYEGTCFRGVGFEYLGLTKGQGRHAPTRECTRTRKKVFAYELTNDWRTHLGVDYVDLRPRLEVGHGLDTDRWAEQEFGKVDLGHAVRNMCLVRNATLVGKTMGNPVTTTMERDPATVQAFWRFWGKADQFGVTVTKILHPHRERTTERARTQDTVICVMDATKMSYSTRPKTTGLDVIGHNQTSAKAHGIHLHATIALNQGGLPLGVLRCAYGRVSPKTRSWIEGLQDADAMAATLPRKTKVMCVMDREADAFDILATQRTLKRTHLLVRAKHNRHLDPKKELRLFKAMRKGPAEGIIELSVERLSRREKSGRVTSNGREPRHARMELRFGKYLLPPTKDATQDPMPVWGIHMYEVSPPAKNEPIEWYLLTTQEITSVEQAKNIVKYYKLRWRIEDHFRVLKTGCKVENLRIQDAKSLHRVITLYMVSAWRIMLMTLLGRETVDLPAEAFFTESELTMMEVYAHTYKVPTHTDLKSAILLVAMMGGYMYRKHDPPPGHEIMWRGYAKLQMRAITYEELKGMYDMVERTPLPSIVAS